MDAIVTNVKIIQNDTLREAFEMLSPNGGRMVSVDVVVDETEKKVKIVMKKRWIFYRRMLNRSKEYKLDMVCN